MQDLDSSLDSLELELYHKPNDQISSIVKYLRQLNLKFCTDPKSKEEDYRSKAQKDNDITQDLGLSRNRFLNRNKTKISTHPQGTY